MKKFFKVLINTMLIAVLVCAVGWYFVGDDLFEKALGNEKQVEAQPQETIVEKEVVAESEPAVEPVPAQTTTNIVFTCDVEISEYVQSAYNAKGIDGVASADVQSLLRDSTFTMINSFIIIN